jgi:hypothetical protein
MVLIAFRSRFKQMLLCWSPFHYSSHFFRGRSILIHNMCSCKSEGRICGSILNHVCSERGVLRRKSPNSLHSAMYGYHQLLWSRFIVVSRCPSREMLLHLPSSLLTQSSVQLHISLIHTVEKTSQKTNIFFLIFFIQFHCSTEFLSFLKPM